MTDPASNPYGSLAETVAAFGATVNPGKAAFFSEAGLELVMGERSGVSFRDAFDGREYLNCHCNGGVFNLGHRNPRVIAAVDGGSRPTSTSATTT